MAASPPTARSRCVITSYSIHYTKLYDFAPLVGVYGIGALCILLAVALVEALERRRYRLLGWLLAVPLAGYALQQVDWTEPLEKPLTVTMVQGNIPQQLKWRPEQHANIFNRNNFV